MPSAHSEYSASSSDAWLKCDKSRTHRRQYPSQSSEFTRRGTFMHAVFETVINERIDANTLIGRRYEIEGQHFVVDRETANEINAAVEHVPLNVFYLATEVHTDYSLALGLPHGTAWGTADVIWYDPKTKTMGVMDLKTGYKQVPVYLHSQTYLYSLGALEIVSLIGEVKTIELTILQSRHNLVRTHTLTIEELREWQGWARHQVQFNQKDPAYRPGKHCEYCPHLANCGAYRQHVSDILSSHDADGLVSFDNEKLSDAMTMVPIVKQWAEAIPKETFRRLADGQLVRGYKLVEGRQGNRKWADPDAVASELQSMKLKHEQIFDYSLISPRSVERLVKDGLIDDHQWAHLQGSITRSDPTPLLTSTDDPRPATTVNKVSAEVFDA